MSISQPGRIQRLTTESKQSFKTTEFWVMVILLVLLFIAGAVTGGNDGGAGAGDAAATGGGDELNAARVWLYAVILAGAYLISRGLAKSGSRDPYWDDPRTGAPDNGIGGRVRAAAEVLRDGPAPPAGNSTEQPTRTQI